MKNVKSKIVGFVKWKVKLMRCKICKKVVRKANTPTRMRLVCGICLKSTKKLLKTIPLVIING